MRSIATMPEALALAGISEDQLLDALLAGRVRSWVRYDWGETQDIPPADWRRVDIHWARSRVSTIQSGGAALFLYNTAVEIDQQTLLDHFGRASEREALKNVGGRPPKWDWRCPISRSSGAPRPPILVGTQPGSTALLRTSGQRRATAKASAAT
jgi:hypothetical protein